MYLQLPPVSDRGRPVGVVFLRKLHAADVHSRFNTQLWELLGVQRPRGIDPNLWLQVGLLGDRHNCC